MPAHSVALLGDSLAVGVSAPLKVLEPGLLTPDVFGGTALCDWLPVVDKLLAQHPDELVVLFAGNNGTPCTGHRTGHDLAELYQRDGETLAEHAARYQVPILQVRPPLATPAAQAFYGFGPGTWFGVYGWTIPGASVCNAGPTVAQYRASDGLHLTDDGYRALAEHIADCITRLTCQPANQTMQVKVAPHLPT